MEIIESLYCQVSLYQIYKCKNNFYRFRHSFDKVLTQNKYK